MDVSALRASFNSNPRSTYDRLPGGQKRRRTGNGPLSHYHVDWLGVLKIVIPIALLAALLFWWIIEVHIEIAFYRKGWVKSAIIEDRPLSKTCFPPSPLYDSALAAAPKLIEPHAGLAMRFGSDCFDFASLVPSQPIDGQSLPDRSTYHLYWRADLKPMDERSGILIDSILKTQDAASSHIVLWSNGDLLAKQPSQEILEPRLRAYPDRLELRQIDFEALSRGTPMQDSPMLQKVNDPRAWVDGDLARVLVLWNYGGLWVDMDHIVLRDLRPLFEHEWVTQWDCYDKPYMALNGAMMHFYKHSPYTCEMLHIMANDPPPKAASIDWGSLLYQKLWRRLVHAGHAPFKILPFCFTDGQTCRLDNRLPDPLSADPSYHPSRWTELERRFAIHLHNQWNKPFPKNGWVRRIVLPLIEERARQSESRRLDIDAGL